MPRPHYCIFIRNLILFDAYFSPFVHTKMPENADANGDFQKWFQKWSLYKMHCFVKKNYGNLIPE